MRVRVEGYALCFMRATHFFVKEKGGEVKAGLGFGSGLRLGLRRTNEVRISPGKPSFIFLVFV